MGVRTANDPSVVSSANALRPGVTGEIANPPSGPVGWDVRFTPLASVTTTVAPAKGVLTSSAYTVPVNVAGAVAAKVGAVAIARATTSNEAMMGLRVADTMGNLLVN